MGRGSTLKNFKITTRENSHAIKKLGEFSSEKLILINVILTNSRNISK
jgi:hypothetical protein